MISLNDIALLGANTVRTKAYIQILCREGIRINRCYLLSKTPETFEPEWAQYTPPQRETAYFNTQEPLLYTLKAFDIPYEFILSEDINHDHVVQRIRDIEEKYLIYSGFGGQIIQARLFESGKKFLHVHPGLLPRYRGSTTIYYSMLAEAACAASAFFLTPGLDEGHVAASALFPTPPKGVNVDYVYEPYIRARVLVQAMRQYHKLGFFPEKPQASEQANTFYIIHPVLKHIALLGIEKGGDLSAADQSPNIAGAEWEA
jgi:methionyl-tRNA formyltransferase